MFLDDVITNLPDGTKVIIPLAPIQKMTAFNCETNSWYDLAKYDDIPESGELVDLPPEAGDE
jgi:hypothetical protein